MWTRDSLPDYVGRPESIEIVKEIMEKECGRACWMEDGRKHNGTGRTYRYLEIAGMDYHFEYRVWGETFHLLKIHACPEWRVTEVIGKQPVTMLFRDFGTMVDFIICTFCEEDLDAVKYYIDKFAEVVDIDEVWEYKVCEWFEAPIQEKEEKEMETIIYTDDINEMIEIVNTFRVQHGTSVTAEKSAGIWEIKFIR